MITVIVTWVYTCQKNKFKLQICTIYTYVNYILKYHLKVKKSYLIWSFEELIKGKNTQAYSESTAKA